MAAKLLKIMKKACGRKLPRRQDVRFRERVQTLFPVHPSFGEGGWRAGCGWFQWFQRLDFLEEWAALKPSVDCQMLCGTPVLLTFTLYIPRLSYFDDFPALSPDEWCQRVDTLVDELFSVREVEYVKSGKKAVKFDTSFATFGLVCDLSDFDSGSFAIRHADRRKGHPGKCLKVIFCYFEMLRSSVDDCFGSTHIVWEGTMPCVSCPSEPKVMIVPRLYAVAWMTSSGFCSTT